MLYTEVRMNRSIGSLEAMTLKFQRTPAQSGVTKSLTGAKFCGISHRYESLSRVQSCGNSTKFLKESNFAPIQRFIISHSWFRRRYGL